MTMVAQGLKTTLLDENLFDVTTQPPPRSNLKKKIKKHFFPLFSFSEKRRWGRGW